MMTDEKDDIESAYEGTVVVHEEPEDVGAPAFDPSDFEVRALGHNDQREFSTHSVAFVDLGNDVLVGPRNLRQQNHVGTAGDSAV